MILQPQANFTIVRQIPDHTDATTYYVRAVIRNAYTDETLATLNLTDKGSQRFKYDWQVPADPSGQGFYISVITSVYSDSGYTTKASGYGDDENTYLVQNRLSRRGGGGGLTAADVRKIVKEAIKEIEFPEQEKMEIPEAPRMRFDEVLSAIEELKATAKELKKKETDLKPILSLLEQVLQAIANKEVTPETDLSPLLRGLQAVHDTQKTNRQELVSLIQGLIDQLDTTTRNAVIEEIKKTKWTTKYVTSAEQGEHPIAERPKEKQEKPVPFDLKSLAI